MTMKKILFFLACALMLASCENYFIDQNLGGNDWIPTDVRTISYTLTDADYTSIVKNATNIDIALGLEEDSVAYYKLIAVDSLKYFENDSVAAYYLPSFITSKFPYLDAGSTVKVAFQMYNPVPEYMAQLDTIHSFTLPAEVYATVWGNNVEIPYLTPKTEGKLLSMIQQNYNATLADGVYAISYDFNPSEPAYSTADEKLTLNHDDYVALTKFVAENKNSKYFAKKDKNKEIDYYLGSNSKQDYINCDYATWRKSYDAEKLYSTLTDAQLAQLHAERLVEGLVNVVLPSHFATPRMGVYTISFLMGVDQSNLTRQSITLMYVGEYKLVSCSFLNQSVNSNFVGVDSTSVGARAALFLVNNGMVDFFTADGITPLVLTPSDYQVLGVEFLDRPERNLPKLLKHKFTFASFGMTYLVVYRVADGSLKAGRYTYNGVDWSVIKDSKQKISSFTNTGSTWEVAPAVYLLESFANQSQGDFTLQNVLLTGGLSYVWIPTASYGMKASAFVNQNNPSEAWLVSPIVDLTEAEKPVISFDQASKFGDLLNECSVRVSVNYEGDVTDCDWVQIPFNQDEDGNYLIPDGSNWTFMPTGDLDLSAFAGQRVTIGFRYTSTASSATTWEVKNVVVKEKK